VLVDDHAENHRALISRFARFLGVLGLDLDEYTRRGDPASERADTLEAGAIAIASRVTHTAILAFADATSAATAVREWAGAGEGVAEVSELYVGNVRRDVERRWEFEEWLFVVAHLERGDEDASHAWR
jgi:hypothetical protein